MLYNTNVVNLLNSQTYMQKGVILIVLNLGKEMFVR